MVGVKQLAYALVLQKCFKMKPTVDRAVFLERAAQRHDELKVRVLDEAFRRLFDQSVEVLLVVGASYPRAQKSVHDEIKLVFEPQTRKSAPEASRPARPDIFLVIRDGGNLKGLVFEVKSYPLFKTGSGEYVQTLLYSLLLERLFSDDKYTCKSEGDVTQCEISTSEGRVVAEISDPAVANLFTQPLSIEGYLVTKNVYGGLEFIRVDTRGVDLTLLTSAATTRVHDKYVLSLDCEYCEHYVNGDCSVFYMKHPEATRHLTPG